ncbi:ABC transporter ATP-binding protein [Halomicroarcula sp. GCM10025817]|uniref:ABC transporter ATP-binding protein n=1 Tax=Haloarcula TaxID=2237 RepID=UPI0023E85E46|nr:ABC transporter ATP-binding protein [Halomicroarcula sp. SYNS111]
MSTDPILAVENLRKSFGGLTAVDGASFDVEKGTIVGLIGPNGAGKSTTFNLITGFYEADEGSVRFRGEEIIDLSPEERSKEGMVRTFQITRELTGMKVSQNMRLGGQDHDGEKVIHAVAGTAKDREAEIGERAEELLRELELWDLRDEYAGNLSGGQRKLLELGRALMAEPDILLLDEPMAGVNPSLTDDIIEMIHELSAQGITFLIVEHDVDMIMNISDKVIGMHQGQVLTSGPPAVVQNDDELLEAYFGGEV